MSSKTYSQTKYILKNLPNFDITTQSVLKSLGQLDITLVEDKGIYRIIDKDLEKFFTKMKTIKVKCTESIVYKFSNILIKIPKKTIYHHSAIRSYYIGKEINNLKYLVPNFINTLCIFSTESKQVMVAYEYINGESLESLINKLSFSEFLSIFVQVLLALEIAQRECSFCHYDLHLNNIILKHIQKPYKYTIVLDNERYDITAEKYIPVILDFGLASSKIKNKTIGSYDYFKYGIMNYLIQGSDMYKFLFHSYSRSKGNLQREIGSLFIFYGAHDPYKILLASPVKLSAISKEYVKDVSTSQIATCTPLEFVKWVFKSYKTSVTVSERNIYKILPTPSKILEQNTYIMIKYNEKMTGEKKRLDTTMIESDKKFLETYKNIKIPNEKKFLKNIHDILIYGKIKKCVYFIDKMTPYLNYLYSIRELGLTDIYEKFIKEFVISPQYLFYSKLYFLAEKGRRWSETLKNKVV